MLKIGIVTHFYDKIGVGIIELTAGLSVGDTVKFMNGEEVLFEQKINSIQIEHEKVEYAAAGSVVGLKLDKPVVEQTELFKL